MCVLISSSQLLLDSYCIVASATAAITIAHCLLCSAVPAALPACAACLQASAPGVMCCKDYINSNSSFLSALHASTR
jgi:hypothetical protein